MIENVSTQLTVFHCLCPLPASRKGLRLTLRSALFGEGGSDWRPCDLNIRNLAVPIKSYCCLLVSFDEIFSTAFPYTAWFGFIVYLLS